MKSIPNHDGYYATKTGDIYRKHKSGKIKKLKAWFVSAKREDYHLGVSLYQNNTKKNRFVHQLILETFEGPRPSPQHLVRHLNDIPYDNRLENLKWGLPGENTSDYAQNIALKKFNKLIIKSHELGLSSEEIAELCECEKHFIDNILNSL